MPIYPTHVQGVQKTPLGIPQETRWSIWRDPPTNPDLWPLVLLSSGPPNPPPRNYRPPAPLFCGEIRKKKPRRHRAFVKTLGGGGGQNTSWGDHSLGGIPPNWALPPARGHKPNGIWPFLIFDGGSRGGGGGGGYAACFNCGGSLGGDGGGGGGRGGIGFKPGPLLVGGTVHCIHGE